MDIGASGRGWIEPEHASAFFLDVLYMPGFGISRVRSQDPLAPGGELDYDTGLTSQFRSSAALGYHLWVMYACVGIEYNSTSVEETTSHNAILRLAGFPWNLGADDDGPDSRGMRSFRFLWWGPYIEAGISGLAPSMAGTALSVRFSPWTRYEFRDGPVNTLALSGRFACLLGLIGKEASGATLVIGLEAGWLAGRSRAMTGTVFGSLTIGMGF